MAPRLPLALRRARVIEAGRLYLRVEPLEGPLAGTSLPALDAFGPSDEAAYEVGEEVIVNLLGPEMGLGTVGVAFVLPRVSSATSVPENEDHFVNLPYTPLQFPAPPPRESEDLAGVPVVVLALHSHLAPACCAAAELRPGARVAFVCQEGGALAVSFSGVVRDLSARGLLHAVVSSGACFGGDVEVPNIYSGLLAAAGPSVEADLVISGIGPGVVGTATPHGHGGMSGAVALNAAASLGARPVLAPRLSGADARSRHLGVSHHTIAVLGAALSECRVALPESAEDLPGRILDGLPPRHSYERVLYGAAGLEGRHGLTFSSMGRTYKQDPVFFDAAAAAVALALGEVGS